MRNKLLVGIAIVLALVVVIGAYRYFGPNDPVQVSPATIYLTAPLAEDGLPNYVLAMLEKERDGVTKENNGAPLFWQAMGPGEMDPELFAALCEELEINVGDPPIPPFLIDVASDETADRLARWIAEQDGTLADLGDAAEQPLPFELLDSAAPHLRSVQARPWTSESLPPLADWLAENDAALDLLVEASKKPRFFSPSPDALLDPHTPVIVLTLEHAQQTRGAVRSLAARAMHRLAAGQHEAAWEDVRACWRFGSLIGNDRTVMELLVGIAIRQVARDTTLAILDSETLPKELATQIQSDLAALPPALDLISAIDFHERLMFLDTTLRHLSGRLDGINDQALTTPQETAAVNLNVPLAMGNSFYDQLAAALAIDDWKDRATALSGIEADLDKRSKSIKFRMIFAFLNRTTRSEVMGDVLLSLMAPAAQTAVDAWERDQVNLRLTQVAAALARYRIEHGAYPMTLEELVASNILPELPIDPYVDAPFEYERRDDGYLLYSLSKNRLDDGGLDLGHPIVAGEWIDDADFRHPDRDSSDLVIRLPLPQLELPIQPAPEDAQP